VTPKSILAPLRHRAFARLYAAQITALLGAGFTTIALALLAYDMAGGQASAVLGLALALKMVAYVAIAPMAGEIAARFPRKNLLIALDLFRAALVLSLPLISQIWQVYLIIFLISAGSAIFTPVFQATIPEILHDEADYTKALSLSRVAYDLENLLSPILAAAALWVLSYHVLFALNGATFLFSAALIVTVTLRATSAVQSPMDWRNSFRAISNYLQAPELRGMLALFFAASVAGALVIVNSVVFVQDFFDGSDGEVALAFAASGAGSMVIALALPKLLESRTDRSMMLIGGALLSIGMLPPLLFPSLTGLFLGWFVIGLGMSFVQTPAGRLLRRAGGDTNAPAFFAAHFSLSHACWLLAYPVAGWLGTNMSFQSVLIICLCLTLIWTMAAARVWSSASHVLSPVRRFIVPPISKEEVNMDHVLVEQELGASADDVWALIKDFNDISAWGPQENVKAAEGTGLGATRTIGLPNGDAVERCDAHSDEKREFQYTLLKSPMNLEHYLATVSILPIDEKRCSISWGCEFSDGKGANPEMCKMIEGAYRNGIIGALQKTVDQKFG
jgi:MFS family permease